MLQAVFCELEGVLADTAQLRYDALRASLSAAGAGDGAGPGDRESHWRDEVDEALHETSRRQRRARVLAAATTPVSTVVRAVLGDRSGPGGSAVDETEVDLAVMRVERHFLQHAARGLSLLPGARDFLDGAAGRVRLALVTRARRREAETVLRLAGIEDAFEFVLAADDAREPKPHPDAYDRALARLDRRLLVQRDRVIALEDGRAGIRSARAAGLRCIAVGAIGDLAPEAALEADGYVPSLAGHDLTSLERLLATRRDEGR